MKLIQRDYYLNRLYAVKDVPDIKVITGVRRSGKSKLMDSFIKMISSNPVNIVHIRLNLKKYERLLNPDNLYKFIEDKYDPQSENYLFVDEIQLTAYMKKNCIISFLQVPMRSFFPAILLLCSEAEYAK